MKRNRIGTVFCVTTWGESHGASIGCVIDGCPSGVPVGVDDFATDLARRAGLQSDLTTPRKEQDDVEILSGIFAGKTTGGPIALQVRNKNLRSADYADFQLVPRPGHADFTVAVKHEHRDYRGGGRSSARETTARVMAGVIAKKILMKIGCLTTAFVCQVGDQIIDEFDFASMSRSEIENDAWNKIEVLREQNRFGVPVPDTKFLDQIAEQTIAARDSLGGTIELWIKGVPVGLGEPVFGKLTASFAGAMMSLPAAVGFAAGVGLGRNAWRGSQVRDSIGHNEDGQPVVQGNKHGGLLGGMTTGSPIRIKVSFHAPTSIEQPVASIDLETKRAVKVEVKGRHDIFPLPRAIVMVEAMAAIVLVDAIAMAGMLPDRFSEFVPNVRKL